VGSGVEKTVTITGYNGTGGAAEIPAVIRDFPVTAIGKDAFDKNVKLRSLTIPASVIIIGDSADEAEDAFDGAIGLTNIIVDEANSVYSSADGVLFNKTKTKLLLYPEGKSGNYTIPSSVTNIVIGAFENCARLTSVTIPDSVTSIGERAFENCIGLTSITIPGSVKIIGGSIRDGYVSGAFNGCTGLKTVTISEGVTSIGAGAFYGCTGLTSITIPDGVTSIGEIAFMDCIGLTSITIPGSVKTIGGSVTDRYFYGTFNSCTGLRTVTISEGVTSIGGTAFIKCVNLTSISIPDSVTYIGPIAFADCTRLTSVTVSPVDGRIWDIEAMGNVLRTFANCPLNNASKTALINAGLPDAALAGTILKATPVVLKNCTFGSLVYSFFGTRDSGTYSISGDKIEITLYKTIM
jgi:hypothetical protein